MIPRAGRASYVGVDRCSRQDPGAVAVTIWMEAVYQTLSSQQNKQQSIE